MDAVAGITAQAMALVNQRQVSYEVYRVTSIQHQKPEVDGHQSGFKRACSRIQGTVSSSLFRTRWFLQ